MVTHRKVKQSMPPQLNAVIGKDMIIAAYLYWVREVKQQDIAIAMQGLNSGRVNEAIRKIGAAAGLCEPGYKERDEP